MGKSSKNVFYGQANVFVGIVLFRNCSLLTDNIPQVVIPQVVNHTSSIPSLLNLSPLPILVTSGSGCTPRGFGVEWSAYQTPTWVNKSPNHQETKLSVFLRIALTFEVTSLKNCRKVPFFNGKLSCGVLEGTKKIDNGVCHLSVNQYSLFGFNSTPG